MKLLKTLTALAAGAAAMYYLDPEQGRRRRAMVRDKLDSARHDAMDYVRATGSDLGNRAQGLVSEAKGKAQDLRSRLSGASQPAMDAQADMGAAGGPEGEYPRAPSDAALASAPYQVETERGSETELQPGGMRPTAH